MLPPQAHHQCTASLRRGGHWHDEPQAVNSRHSTLYCNNIIIIIKGHSLRRACLQPATLYCNKLEITIIGPSLQNNMLILATLLPSSSPYPNNNNSNNNRRLVTLAEHTSDHGKQKNSSTKEVLFIFPVYRHDVILLYKVG